jgi:hypothetical protein
MSGGAQRHMIASCAIEMRSHLQELQAERAQALIKGLESSCAYMAVLDEVIAATRHAYVGAAVTEIATLRAELSGPQLG